MKDNLKLWRSVEKTDPKYTKAVNIGRGFTTINAHYQIMQMTKAFGSIGSGWGVCDEFFNPLIDGLIGYTARLWYMEGDKKRFFCINSSISTHSRAGKLDDECYKKVSTDALTKGISKLGFNADIFLGKWDDNRYVQEMTEHFNPTEPEVIEINIGDDDFATALSFVAKNKKKGLKWCGAELNKMYNLSADAKHKIAEQFQKKNVKK